MRGRASDESARRQAEASLDRLFAAVRSDTPVSGHTHNFYRYPARFSPQFARAVIEAFTSPGDTVLDPFLGGATTAIEALVAGRRFLGCDLNPLAVFVARAKTTPLSKRDARELTQWAELVRRHVNLHTPTQRDDDWAAYQRNVPWRHRKTLQIALNTVTRLATARQRMFARCTLLKTAQWALDCRLQLPSIAEFVQKHDSDMTEMLEAARSFGHRLGEAFSAPPSSYRRYRRLLCRTAAGLHTDGRIPRAWLPPRLVLTSPPYVGIHVLYHRWQVQGRKETPAPYWLANCQDGRGASHYTFGDYRRQDVVETYADQLRESFRSVVELLDERSLVVQLVAFSDPDTQLPPYLDALRSAGLVESDVYGFAGSLERVWRIIPNRKWYARIKGDLPAREEVLLIHRKRKSAR
jgi:hypothetical protein